MRKTIAVLVLAVGVALPTSSALGAVKNPHATYALGHAKKCRVDFVKRTERHKVDGKEKRYVACVYQAPEVLVPVTSVIPTTTPTTAPTAPTPSYSYEAHVDPTFTQGALPLDVTYSYSAGATETLNGVKTDMAQAGSLPGGVLQLFSDGLLACSINVGGGTNSGQCPVTYSTYGNHQVVTTYNLNGVAPVTETDSENIEPFASTTTVGAATVGAETVDSSNNYAVTVTFPVTISGAGAVPTGSISGPGLSCTVLTAGSGTCLETVENAAQATSLAPTINYSGDVNYGSSGSTGQATVPAAPAPQTVNVTTVTTCTAGVPAPVCVFLSNDDNTINGAAQVSANGVLLYVGTITFTDANNVVLCVATIIPDQAIARCSGPYSGGNIVQTPVTATYSGSSAAVGDAYVDNYQTSSESGHAN